MALPKRLYHVKQRGANLRYGQRGGGTFTQQAHAVQKVRELRRQGGTVELYVTECDWIELSSDALDGP